MNEQRKKSLQAQGFNNVMLYFGTQQNLAAGLKITKQAVNKWAKKKCVPLNRLLDVYLITGIPVYHIRPDLFDEF